MKTYDDIAEWYDQWIGTSTMEDNPIFAEVAPLLGELRGRRICDLACGQGRVARHLAQLGAHVVGVDLSAKLLAIARHHEESDPRGIEYVQADARQLDDTLADTFDGVLCFMALMDIQDLAPTFHSVARILRPGGWFVFSILHPCFHTSRSGEMETPEGTVRTIGRYFEQGHWRSHTRPGPPGRVGSYHRKLSTYLNTLTAAGLQLVRMSEPGPSPLDPHRPVWDEVPSILIVSSRKP